MSGTPIPAPTAEQITEAARAEFRAAKRDGLGDLAANKRAYEMAALVAGGRFGTLELEALVWTDYAMHDAFFVWLAQQAEEQPKDGTWWGFVAYLASKACSAATRKDYVGIARVAASRSRGMHTPPLVAEAYRQLAAMCFLQRPAV